MRRLNFNLISRKITLSTTMLCLAVAFSPGSSQTPEPVDVMNPIETLKHGDARRLHIEYDGIAPLPLGIRIRAAKADLIGDFSADRYQVYSRARVAGIAALFLDYNLIMKSEGEVTNEGLRPLLYSSGNETGRKDRKVKVRYENEDVVTLAEPPFPDMGKPPATLDDKLKSRDPLTALMNVAVDPYANDSNPCGEDLRFFDGKQRFDIKLSYVGNEKFRTNGWSGEAIKCSAEYVELGGFGHKTPEEVQQQKEEISWAYVWVGEIKNTPYRVPLKMEFRHKKRGKLTIKARKVRLTSSPIFEEEAINQG